MEKNLFNFLLSKISMNIYRKCLFAFVVGIITHFYIITNLAVNHDSMVFMTEKNTDYAAGRWARVAIGNFFSGDYQSPWMIGITAIFFLSLSAVLIVEYLGEKAYWKDALIIILLMTFPVLASNFAYMFMSNEYAIALFCACLGIHLLEKNRWKTNVVAVISFILCCAIYQSYIQVAGVLIVIKLFVALIGDGQLVISIRQFIRRLLYLVLGMALYYIITLLVLNVLGITLNRDVGNRDYWECIKYLYSVFFNNIVYDKGIGGNLVSGGIIIATYIMVFVRGCWILWKKKDNVLRVIIFVLLFVLAPIYFNPLYLVVGTYIHQLMEYSFVLLWIFPIILLDKIFEGKCKILFENVAIVLALLFALKNMIFCNTCYYSLCLSYETSYALANRIVSHIEALDEWEKETPVQFVGVMGYTETDIYGETKELLHKEAQVVGFELGDYMYNAPYLLKYYMNDYLGVRLREPSEEVQERILQDESVINMPCFPDAGSICEKDGVVVVKLSNYMIERSTNRLYDELYIR